MAARCRILVVDDEADNRRVYGFLLEKEGYAVKTASNAADALAAAIESPPDLIISDVTMPGDDGLTFLKKIKAEKSTQGVPFILMSGVRKGADEQAEGIEKGADDYLPKPVPPALLRAKVAAVLRRYDAPRELVDTLKTNGLTLDVAARVVKVGGKRVPLTRKEFDLLTTLMRRRGRVLSIPYLLETVWGYDPADYSDPHTVGVHVSTLRKKIGKSIGDRIVSVPGLGYRFDG
jgi:DNA-binding response OmpR family regulator